MPYTAQKGDRIAQMVFINVAKPILTEVDSLMPTERADGGFGSTDRIRTLTQTDILDDITPPYHVYLSHDPYDDYIEVKMELLRYDDHPTAGLQLEVHSNTAQLILMECIPGS